MIGMAQRNITSFFTTGRKSITTASSSSSHCLQDHMYHVAASSDRFDSESVRNTGTDSNGHLSMLVMIYIKFELNVSVVYSNSTVGIGNGRSGSALS